MQPRPVAIIPPSLATKQQAPNPKLPPPLWAALGCLREKGVTEYYVTRFDHLRKKGKHRDPFVSALPGAPGSSLL